MPDHTRKSKVKTNRRNSRRFESEAQGLMTLRLIAAPNPKDDLSDAQLRDMCHDSSRSPELIQLLIDAVKSL